MATSYYTIQQLSNLTGFSRFKIDCHRKKKFFTSKILIQKITVHGHKYCVKAHKFWAIDKDSAQKYIEVMRHESAKANKKTA